MHTTTTSAAAPVIICGMHRSGTSLLCRALEAAGLFTGEQKEHNHEAVFFLTLNQWIFEQLGATWDNPYNMRFLNEDLGEYLQAVIRNILDGPSASAYTGPSPGHQSLFHSASSPPWGWKDPRNTFTADLWARLFPRARIIHVCRNPLDVADSLRRREHAVVEQHQAQLAKMQPEQLDGSLRYQQSPRLFHFTEGLALWEEYCLQALSLEQRFADNMLRVRYEDFLDNPVGQLRRLANFAGLQPGNEQLQAAASQVNPSRRYAFTGNPDLVRIYDDFRGRYIMKALGYDRIDTGRCHSAA